MQSSTRFENISALKKSFPNEQEIWAVDVAHQCLHRIHPGHALLTTPISSSRFGLGNAVGSLKTPLGAHRVCEIIGKNEEVGQPFKSRVPEGEVLKTFTGGQGDAILTRILWLDGIIPELNCNSKSRYIYIHGTHQEEKLGQAASQGCIRMGNQILADWTDSLQDTLPLVWIGTIDAHHA